MSTHELTCPLSFAHFEFFRDSRATRPAKMAEPLDAQFDTLGLNDPSPPRVSTASGNEADIIAQLWERVRVSEEQAKTEREGRLADKLAAEEKVKKEAEARQAAEEKAKNEAEARQAAEEARQVAVEKLEKELAKYPVLMEAGFPKLGDHARPAQTRESDANLKMKPGILGECSFENFENRFQQTTEFKSTSASAPVDGESTLQGLVTSLIKELLGIMKLSQFTTLSEPTLSLLTPPSASLAGVGSGKTTGSGLGRRVAPDATVVTINGKPIVCVEVKLPPADNSDGEALQASHLRIQARDYMEAVYLASGVKAQFAVMTNYKYVAFLWTEEANELAQATLDITSERLQSWATAAARFHPEPFLNVHPSISTSSLAKGATSSAKKANGGTPVEPESGVEFFSQEEEKKRFDLENMYASESYRTEEDPKGVRMLCSVLIKAIIGFISPYVQFKDVVNYDLATVDGVPVDDVPVSAPRVLSNFSIKRAFLQLSSSYRPCMTRQEYPTQFDYAQIVDAQTSNFVAFWYFHAGADGRTVLAFHKSSVGVFKFCVLKIPYKVGDSADNMAKVEVERWNRLYSDVWPRQDPAFVVSLKILEGTTVSCAALPYVGPVDKNMRSKPEFQAALDKAIENTALKGLLHQDLHWRHVGLVFRDGVMRVILFDLSRMEEFDANDTDKVESAVKNMRDQLGLE